MSLFDVEPVTRQRPLGARQQFVIDQLQAHDGALTALEAGRMLHTGHGKPCDRCQPHAACEYAERDARSVLRSLRDRGLVVRRRDTGLWELLDASNERPKQEPARRPTPHYNEFPEGF